VQSRFGVEELYGVCLLSDERGGIFATLCAIRGIGNALAGVGTFYDGRGVCCMHKNSVVQLGTACLTSSIW
jgi:hypothetical protein